VTGALPKTCSKVSCRPEKLIVYPPKGFLGDFLVVFFVLLAFDFLLVFFLLLVIDFLLFFVANSRIFITVLV